MRSVVVWVVLFACVSISSVASAQLPLAQRSLARADFTRAIRAFDRAERQAHLSREDLLAIYEGRAMARWAMGDERHAQRDLAALAELDPHHAFPPEAPPELGEAFADVAREGGLDVVVSFADATGSSTITVDVHHDDAGLVRSLATHVRVGDGAWSESDASTVRVDVPEGEHVEVWVEAVGPGDAVIGGTGSADAPVVHGGGPQHELDVPTPVVVAPPPPLVHEDEGAHDDTGIWIGVGVGVGVVVAIAVIVGVVVGVGSAPSDHTQPDAPVVRF